MKVTRWPALTIFATLIVAALLLWETDDKGPQTQIFERNEALLVGTEKDLSSTWYCVAGTVGGSEIANHEILLGNPSNISSEVSITVVPVLAPRQANLEGEEIEDKGLPKILQLPSATTEIWIPERSMISVELSEIQGVSGEFASAFIQSSLGNLVVEHKLSGQFGSSQKPCASNASTEWNFAAGTTRAGAREMISIFNPFPDNAVLDITFSSDGRTRRPEAYSGIVLPPDSLIPIDITEVVTLAETVSTRIETRIGRVVAERTLYFGDEFQPYGLSTEIGSPSLNDLWVFPGGFGSVEAESLIVYNPSSSLEANVDIEIISDIESGPYIEPINISIKPGSSEEVAFQVSNGELQETRAIDVSSRIPRGVPFWLVVRSLNDIPVVSERSVLSFLSGTQLSGSNLGVNVSGKEHFSLVSSSEGKLAITHPASDRLTLVQLFAYAGGNVYESQVIEVSARSRKIVDLQQLGIPDNSVVRISSSEPVSIERYLGSQTEGEWSRLPIASNSLIGLFVEATGY